MANSEDLLKKMSVEALVLWRQVLREPIVMPHWEATGVKAVKELKEAGLVTISRLNSIRWEMDLPSSYRSLRFSKLQKKLVDRLTRNSMLLAQFPEWSRQNGIENWLPFMKRLVDLRIVRIEGRPSKRLYYTLY